MNETIQPPEERNGDGSNRKTDRLERVTLFTLAERGPLHVLDIAESSGEHPVAIDLACARLHDRGDVRAVGFGRYDLTDRGRQRCRERSEAIRSREGSPP